jgi:hypothetical protein
MAFTYTYNPLTYQQAQTQAGQQLDPLYNRALQNVNQQKYQSDVQAGQVSAARGLGHSGLAADQLNKIAIAAQGQIGDLSAQHASQLAQSAQELMNNDKTYGLQARSQAYQEYAGDRDYNYQTSRDKVSDSQWQKQFDYTKLTTDREWNQMSPAEKARMALQASYAKKSSGGGGGGSSSRGRRSSGSRKNTSTKPSTPVTNSTTPKKTTYQNPLDTYYNNPYVTAGQKTGSPYLSNPLPPAQNPNLSAWDKIKLLGL